MIISDYVKKYVPQNGFIVDVGANIGNIAANLAEWSSATVIALEPGPLAFRKLFKKAIEWQGPGKILPVRLGLCGAKDNGKALEMFHNYDWTLLPAGHPKEGDTHLHGSADEDCKQVKPFLVNYTTLDDFLLNHLPGKLLGGVNLIKVDVDGAEEAVFEGMEKTISNISQPPIFMEVGRYTMNKVGGLTERLVDSIFKKNFKVWKMYGDRFTEHLKSPGAVLANLRATEIALGPEVVLDLLLAPPGKEPI